MKINYCFLLLLFIASGISLAAPDAGQLLQEIEKQQDAGLPKPTFPEITPTLEQVKSVDGDSVIIVQFQFAGNTLISNGDLEEVITSYLNRPLTFDDLQQVVVDVAESYRKSG